MINYNNLDELMNMALVKEKELSYQGNIYTFKKTNSNVQRGDFSNLIATTFYNEEERHHLTFHYDSEHVRFVESGYGTY